MEQHSGATPSRGALAQIPRELAGVAAWCAWELREIEGKPRKVPIHPDGRQFSTSKDKPYSFADVQGVGTGVGLVLTGGVKVDGKTLVGFDCDACRDPKTGALMPWVDRLRTLFKNTYTEVTPSGHGVRVLALVDELPTTELRKVRSLDPAPNTTKRPEIETFGLGRACYITVTGDLVPGSSTDLEISSSLERFTSQHPSAIGGLLGELPELPAGTGTAPDLDAVDRLVRAHPEGDALARGLWEDVVPDESASEGFYRLVQRAVRAANGHGDVAARWLLERTSFGAGKVDSAEPDRYMSEEWVGKEVARIAAKAPRTDAGVFDAPYVESASMPSEAALEERQLAAAAEDDAAILQVDDFVETVAGREWLVDELFPSDGLASVFGKPGQGKTPVTLRLAIACAAGLPTFFGRRMEQHGPVVVFVGEDEAGVRDRVLAQLNEIDPLLIGSGLPLYFTREPGRLTDPENIALWLRRIHGATGGVTPRLVVVDTLARNFGGGNENATEDMQAFVDGCDALSRHLDKCLVVCTHHPSKGNDGAGRGSGVLLGALDTELKVELVGRTKLVVTPTKVKGGPLPEQPLIGTLVPVRHGLGMKSDGTPRSAITLDDNPPDPGAVFGELAGDSETVAILKAIGELEGPTPRSTLATAIGVSSKVLRGLEVKLVGLELIEVRKGPSERSPLTYHLTAQGSRVISSSRNPFALEEGQRPFAPGEGQSEGTEGKDDGIPF